MPKLKRLALAGTACMIFTLTSGVALASSHREAPNVTKMPKVDNTDVYAFQSYETGKTGMTTIIANFQPGQFPGAGPNYWTMDPDAQYQIHIDNNGDAKEDLTYSFQFTNTLQNGTGITLNVGGTTNSIPLRYAGPVAQPSDANLAESEAYTITQISGDQRSGSRQRRQQDRAAVQYICQPVHLYHHDPRVLDARPCLCRPAGRSVCGEPGPHVRPCELCPDRG
jgi:hypothetical protein